MDNFELLQPKAVLSLSGEFGIVIIDLNKDFVEWYYSGTGQAEPIHKSRIFHEEDEELGLRPYFTHPKHKLSGVYYLDQFIKIY